MKKLLLLLLVFITSISCSSESKEQAPNGALNVHFGWDKEKALSTMKNQGYSITSEKPYFCYFNQGEIFDITFETSVIEFNSDNTVKCIAIFFAKDTSINTVKKVLENMYGNRYEIDKDINNDESYIWYWKSSDNIIGVSLSSFKDGVSLLFSQR